MPVAVHVRSLVARHRWIPWSLLAALAAMTALAVDGQMRRLDDARSAWGARRAVLVATTAAEPGDPIAHATRELPVIALPDTALEPLALTPGATAIALRRVAAGQVLTLDDVGTGRASLVPYGWLAVSIGAGEATIPLSPGDPVAVLAEGALIAGDGVVIGVAERSVTVVVPAEIAPEVARCAVDGTATLALRPVSAGPPER